MHDDVYMGYRIPKGAVILPNIWYFLNDPEVYPNPEKFIPERHISEGDKGAATDPRLYCFGFGRRCVAVSWLSHIASTNDIIIEFALGKKWQKPQFSSLSLWFWLP